MSAGQSRPVTRRTFLETAAKTGLAAGVLAGAPGLLTASARAAGPRAGMNILLVMVDQLRTPWVYMSPKLQRSAMPTVTRLGEEGVRFSNYFTSSNDCTPSRTTQATGLYTHQTAIFATTPPTDLNPGFPTWGTMLRQNGYDTYWFGKWHLSGGQNGGCGSDPYEAYGFTADWPGSGTCPSPNGGAGQGLAMDPVIRQQFRDWIGARDAGGKPWATTVSFVNPHDIAWYPRSTRQVEGQSNPPSVYQRLPANFESALGRRARNKPEMQRRAQQIENESFGLMPAGREHPRLWTKMLDTYLLMQSQVDVQIGLVLDALDASPFADDTIVVFVSDHGEYGGAHGMRGKGFAFYDEGVRVPLIVKDPTGGWTQAHQARPPPAGRERGPGGADADARHRRGRLARRLRLRADRRARRHRRDPAEPDREGPCVHLPRDRRTGHEFGDPDRAAARPRAQPHHGGPHPPRQVRPLCLLEGRHDRRSTSHGRSTTRPTTTPPERDASNSTTSTASEAPARATRRWCAGSTSCSTRR